MRSLFFVFLQLAHVLASILTDSQIKGRLPGLHFEPKFKSYSGYLDAKNKNGTSNWRMFYWLTESKNEPAKDPLAIYYSGGPGCSSVGETFEEMGPFYVNYDGKSLYENIYAWNARANVLYLDSPIGVGFSYNTEAFNYSIADDDQTAQQNYMALIDFFARVAPEYSTRDFYLTGSSYSGVWQPMLADLIVTGINGNQFPNKNFKGFAIGNGYLDVVDLTNALVMWNGYHSRTSISDWNQLKDACYIRGVGRQYDMDTYDFTRFLTSSDNLGWESDGSTCGNMLIDMFETPDNEILNEYTYYEDCWGFGGDGVEAQKKMPVKKNLAKMRKGFEKLSVYRKPNSDPGVNTATLLNFDSPDNEFGYPCWHGGALWYYMNQKDVQKAFNVDPEWMKAGLEWGECNGAIGDQYNHKYPSMEPFFDRILDNWKGPLKILLYNGDVDTVCNYLGDARFARRVALNHKFKEGSRNRWRFRGITAGWQQRYTNGQVTIDVLTVKGAGHFVPNDRGGAAVQMISGFLNRDPPMYDNHNLTDPTPIPIGLDSKIAKNPTTISLFIGYLLVLGIFLE